MKQSVVPGFWKFNNSVLMVKCYTGMMTKQIPEFVAKYCNLNDKGLFWEMIKMEIRASTIILGKNKAKQKRNEEKRFAHATKPITGKVKVKY